MNPGVDSSTVVAATLLTAAVLVLASWVVLAIVALARLTGIRPAAGQGLRRLIQAAAFIGVLGAFMAVGMFVDFGVSMSHFDTGVPADQQVILDVAMVALLIIGTIVGAAAIRRVPDVRHGR